MKIRSDFVTNSSTTSFLIISDEEFTKDKFLNLVGIGEESPLIPLFEKLYAVFKEKMTPLNSSDPYNRDVDIKRMIDDGLKEGKKVYSGRLSSDDGDAIEAYFCTDSFELKNDVLYINGVSCFW